MLFFTALSPAVVRAGVKMSLPSEASSFWCHTRGSMLASVGSLRFYALFCAWTVRWLVPEAKATS